MLVYDVGYQFTDHLHKNNYYTPPPPGEEHYDHQHQHLWYLDCAEYDLDKVHNQNTVFLIPTIFRLINLQTVFQMVGNY